MSAAPPPEDTLPSDRTPPDAPIARAPDNAPALPASGHYHPLQSLRARLTVLLLGVVLLAALFQGVSAYHTAQRQADALLDAHLQQMADALRGGVAHGPNAPPDRLSEAEERALTDLLVQIWGHDGAPLFRSPNADLPRRAVLGFSDITVDGTSYRVYSLQTPLQTIQIAQDMTARQQRAQALAWRAVWPIAAAAPLLMLAVWGVIGLSLRPVERARRQLARRQANDLSPIDEHGLPTEVQPLVHELNQLFARVQTAFQAQKSFVADAAHELRSPLAALRLQAQTLKVDPADAGQQKAVRRLTQGIARASGLVEQLLVLAREEASGETTDTASPAPRIVCDVQQPLRLAAADVLPQAAARRIDLGLTDAPRHLPTTTADAQALRILLRNLLENAVKYSREGGVVDITLHTDKQDRPVITIDDSGPGIAPAERERVFDRFYRSPDLATAAPGNGLGLAIVRTIVQRQGIEITLGDAPARDGQPGGLRVTLALPSALA
ncbi:MAG: Sensor protein QseC [Paracidovorax wautersii]|uniref:histidine kinase n=1 Tax=Paracidovorax wautersii TaxID=1177982 RepID=A0A7V8JPB3_9BURK|nr:MAG: Sensor protein QseC [Paracidovorax wautersii]